MLETNYVHLCIYSGCLTNTFCLFVCFFFSSNKIFSNGQNHACSMLKTLEKYQNCSYGTLEAGQPGKELEVCTGSSPLANFNVLDLHIYLNLLAILWIRSVIYWTILLYKINESSTYNVYVYNYLIVFIFLYIAKHIQGVLKTERQIWVFTTVPKVRT